MARRLLVLTGAAFVLLCAASGVARADTYCVTPAVGCDGPHTFATLQAALTGVAGNGVGDTIQLGAAAYAENGLTYAGADPVSIVGTGTAGTTLRRATAAGGSSVLNAAGGGPLSLSHLRVHLLFAAATVTGIQLSAGGTLDDVLIDADPGGYNPTGLQIAGTASVTRSTVDIPSGGSCVSVTGVTSNTTLTDDLLSHCGIGLNMQGGTALAERLRIVDSGTGVNAGGGSAVTVEDSLFTFSSGSTALSASASGSATTLTASHVTAVGAGAGTGGSAFNAVTTTATLNLRHSILRGFAVSLDRHGTNPGSHVANIVADYNDYNAATVTETGPGTITSTHVYNNVDPLFVNAGAGDYHLSGGSPLIDQDLTALAAGESPFDFDGNVRIINDKRDLGAYEHVLFPGTVTGEPAAVTATSATVSGLVNPGGAQTTWKVVYGTSPTAIVSATAAAIVSATAAATLSPSVANLPVSTTLTGLSPGTTYYYGFTATNSAGTTSPDLRSFTTAAGQAPKPRLSRLRLSPTSFLAARSGASLAAATGARLSYQLSRDATVTFRVRRLLSGVRSGKRCVAPRKGRRKGRRCTRAKLVKGSFKRVSTAGANHARFSGRVGRRALARGRYRLTGTPSAAGGRGRAASVNFKIVGLAKKR